METFKNLEELKEKLNKGKKNPRTKKILADIEKKKAKTVTK
jgi:hypothetical protein